MSHFLTPDHPQWDEFVIRLEGPEGCDFQQDSYGKTTWKCCGHGGATDILTAMGFDEQFVAGSLLFFREHGGYCDCEILFNVEADCEYP